MLSIRRKKKKPTICSHGRCHKAVEPTCFVQRKQVAKYKQRKRDAVADEFRNRSLVENQNNPLRRVETRLQLRIEVTSNF